MNATQNKAITLEISQDEKLTLLYALQGRAERLEKYLTDCESLGTYAVPTDNPETWRKQIREVRALFNRISHQEQQ